ncbi:MAG: RsmG family class I SAM-dependent methyltransferase, partial [Acidimicrobiales bacterium]
MKDHVRHSGAFAALISELGSTADAPSGRILDLGSGGGVPGLALALLFPRRGVWLLEGSSRRAAWLRQTVTGLGLSDRVTVIGERAESAARRSEWRSKFSTIAARSFGRPGIVAECGAAFLEVGGSLVVSEPPPDPAREGEVRLGLGTPRWPSASLEKLGLGAAQAHLSDGFG